MKECEKQANIAREFSWSQWRWGWWKIVGFGLYGWTWVACVIVGWKIVEWIGLVKIECLGFILDNGIHSYMLLWNIKPLQNSLQNLNLQKNFVLTTKWITIIKDLVNCKSQQCKSSFVNFC